MDINKSKVIDIFMNHLVQETEVIGENCIILAYLHHLNIDNPWPSKFLKLTYEHYTKTVLGPRISDSTLSDAFNVSKGYCFLLLQLGISSKDVAFITSEGLDFLKSKNQIYMNIYDSFVSLELADSNSEYRVDVADVIFTQIDAKIENSRVALQFILEELEAASFGSLDAQEFVSKHAFIHEELKGSMSSSMIEVDGPNGPQQTLTRMIWGLNCEMETKVIIRLSVVQKIIEKWGSDDDNKIIDIGLLF